MKRRRNKLKIEVKNLDKSFGDFHAIKNISFTIEEGQLIGFLGPSGGGKTTVLRMLAGLESSDSGEIYFNGKLVNGVSPQDRGIGFVFQNYALFRHMTVYENIAFGLKVKKKSKADIHKRVTELLELTGLAGKKDRYPHELSGGQRQRVAFARALAPEPQLLLLDEPFAAIDAKVRKELRSWLREMINRVGITTIFVTHDQEEAVEVADEILIINQGNLEQQGTPISIYRNPQTPFVAGFIGQSDILAGNQALIGFDQVGHGGQVVIRPEFIQIGLAKEISLKHAAEKGNVSKVFFRGNSWHIEVKVGDLIITGDRSLEAEPLEVGQEVYVLIHRVYLFSDGDVVTLENTAKQDPEPVFI
jgi:sulfate transport system ATP-binding protein